MASWGGSLSFSGFAASRSQNIRGRGGIFNGCQSHRIAALHPWSRPALWRSNHVFRLRNIFLYKLLQFGIEVVIAVRVWIFRYRFSALRKHSSRIDNRSVLALVV